jgi:hypothetical protein
MINKLFDQYGSLISNFLLDFCGPDLAKKIHDIISIANTIMLARFGRHKNLALWIIFLAICMPAIFRWYSSQKLKRKIARIRKWSKRELDSENPLQATAVMDEGKEFIVADIERVMGYYVLMISTKRIDCDAGETRHQFNSIDSLSEFLEHRTILRLGDFNLLTR